MYVNEKNTFLDFQYPTSQDVDGAELGTIRRHRSESDLHKGANGSGCVEGWLTFQQGKLSHRSSMPTQQTTTIAAQLQAQGAKSGAGSYDDDGHVQSFDCAQEVMTPATESAQPCQQHCNSGSGTFDMMDKNDREQNKSLEGEAEVKSETSLGRKFNTPSKERMSSATITTTWSGTFNDSLRSDPGLSESDFGGSLFTDTLTSVCESSAAWKNPSFDELGFDFGSVPSTFNGARPMRGPCARQGSASLPLGSRGHSGTQHAYGTLQKSHPMDTPDEAADDDDDDGDDMSLSMESQEKSTRSSQGSRQRYRKLLLRLIQQLDLNPEAFDLDALDLPSAVARNPQQKAKLMKSLAKHKAKCLELVQAETI